MIKVYISYSPEMSVPYCFWKYFFQLSGIWVSTEKIATDWMPDVSKSPQLVILDEHDKEKIRNERYHNIVYCVKKTSEEISDRNDIVKVNWRERSFYNNVLGRLLEGYKEQEALFVLLGIFSGTDPAWKLLDKTNKGRSEGLWGASWLFHEIAQSSEGRWDQEIIQTCYMAIKILDKQKESIRDNWNCRFMKLYCEYMQCRIRDKTLIKRINGCKELLVECNKLARKEGWVPVLCVLTGKVSSLSPTENKYAVSYYSWAVEYEEQAPIYYDIGHIYEKAYGNEEKALQYYKKSYQCNKQYYRAFYKLVISLENKGKWMDAIGGYGKIREMIWSEKVKDSISVREIEYDYKTCKRIMQLCRQNINDISLLDRYQEEIKEMHDHVELYVDYTNLIKAMYHKENYERKCQEINEELRNKLEIECCK